MTVHVLPPVPDRMPVTVKDWHGKRVEYGAYLSPDGVYRYVLQRAWSNTRPLVAIGLNPSTADGLEDDPTIRVLMGLAWRWQFTGLVMVNAFAYRATEPADLLRRLRPPLTHTKQAAVIGPENDEWLRQAASFHDSLFLACWGANCPDWRAREVAAIFPTGRLACLGRNKDGSPKHPLRVKVTGLGVWSPP